MIAGERRYLWCAVYDEGEVLDPLTCWATAGMSGRLDCAMYGPGISRWRTNGIQTEL